MSDNTQDNRPAPPFIRKWIEDRYGPISITTPDEWTYAWVKVFKGTAHGRGKDEEKAINALYDDLTIPGYW